MTETTDSQRVTGAELRQIVERIEFTDQQKQEAAEAQKEIYADAKSRGYCTKTIRKLVALRKRDENDIAEEEAVLDMYKSALGMS